MVLSDPQRTHLAVDPSHRACAINGYAFQQDAIHTFNGWQYVCFYASRSPSAKEPLFVHLSRRKLPAGPWQTIRFDDYPQTVDDGHNTVQFGICPGDGTIHLSYDHHCDVLRYRHSAPDVATSPETVVWSPALFTTTSSTLPGLEDSIVVAELLGYITYPRFVTSGRDLLFTFRTGKAGLGDDHLCVYTADVIPTSSHTSSAGSATLAESGSTHSSSSNNETGSQTVTAKLEGDIDTGTQSGSGSILPSNYKYKYKFLGTHLRGVGNNPYIHGLNISPSRPFSTSTSTSPPPLNTNNNNTTETDNNARNNGVLHATWVYRDFVPYPGWDDPLDTQHKAQAGPNSAANNHDICHAWSADGGVRWCVGDYTSTNNNINTNNNTETNINDNGNERGTVSEVSNEPKDLKDKRTSTKTKTRPIVIADLSKGESILPTSPGILAFRIPKGSGLTNQESQAVDYEGGVHVLNRDALDDDDDDILVQSEGKGEEMEGKGDEKGDEKVVRWKHYYRDPLHGWTKRTLPYVEGACGGKRGQVVVSRDGDVYFVLPHHTDPILTILKSQSQSKAKSQSKGSREKETETNTDTGKRYTDYDLVWQGTGFFPPSDPLVDKARLGDDNVLSILTRTQTQESGSETGTVNVTVLDFTL